MKPLYTITFENNSKYRGGSSYQDTKWINVPNDKRIKRIFYKLPTRGYLCLENFSKIYHYVEAYIDLTGKNRGKTNIKYIYLLIKKENKVLQYKISYVTGTVDLEIFDENDSYIQKLNPVGWKKGNEK